MAKLVINIPDGEFCSDKGHLACMYADMHSCQYPGWCTIFNKQLNQLEDVTVNGEW